MTREGWFYASIKRADRAPTTLVTDRLASNQAWRRAYAWGTALTNVPEHVREITLRGAGRNSKMERMIGEIQGGRDEGLRRENAPVLKGLQIYHNFI